MRRVALLASLSLLAGALVACNDDAPSDTTTADTGTDSGTDESDTSEGETTGGPDMGLDMGVPETGCVVEPSDAALSRPGPQDDGSVILVNGRRTESAGPSVMLPGMGADIAAHPVADVAYLVTAGRNNRHLYVIDRATREVLQDIDRGVGFYGLRVHPDGSRLYASNGVPSGIEYFDVDANGMLTAAGEVAIAGWTAGMDLSPDGSTLWVTSFDADRITQIDTATMTVTDTLFTGLEAFDLLHLDSRDELWATEFAEDGLAIYDLAGDQVAQTLSLPTSPSMMVANADQSQVFVSVSGADTVVAIDAATREVVQTVRVAEEDFVDAMGEALPHSNPGALWFDDASDRLYVARGSDAAVGVFDATTLAQLGSIPTNWYPMDIALSPDGGQLLTAEARANGSRTHLVPDSDNYLAGASFIDLGAIDLTDTTNMVVENFRRPLDIAAEPECGDDFPLPTDYSGSPVIEHVVLIVNENQTFDAIFGTSGDALGVAADPDNLKWEESITVNKRALAERFVIGDNFYTDADESDGGHAFLTATHWTDFVERIRRDRDEYNVLGFYPTSEPAIPDKGNFFAWVVDNGLTLQIYGEVVGITAQSSQGPIAQFADNQYPGGLVINYDVKDEVKAQYVAEQVAAGNLANFTFISLPNDHGQGIQPGKPTPPSMTADTDYGVGIVVDAISHSPFWENTVIIVIQDDPQGSADHIDENRSPLLVISPWVRTGYASHAHYSFPALFATIERLLGLPPLGRPDASAAPMYDLFTDVPNLAPFDAIPREFPEELGDVTDPGVHASRCMDFRGPDRNPGLGIVTDHYLAWRRGELTAEQAEAAIAADLANPELLEWAIEEAEEETTAWAEAMDELRAMAPTYGWTITEPPASLGPAPDCPALDFDDDD